MRAGSQRASTRSPRKGMEEETMILASVDTAKIALGLCVGLGGLGNGAASL